MNQEFKACNIFDALIQVSQTREVITKNGELASIREFEVGDASTQQLVPLTLWDREWIKLADKWESKQTVLFLADAFITVIERVKKSALSIGKFNLNFSHCDIKKMYWCMNFR